MSKCYDPKKKAGITTSSSVIRQIRAHVRRRAFRHPDKLYPRSGAVALIVETSSEEKKVTILCTWVFEGKSKEFGISMFIRRVPCDSLLRLLKVSNGFCSCFFACLLLFILYIILSKHILYILSQHFMQKKKKIKI